MTLTSFISRTQIVHWKRLFHSNKIKERRFVYYIIFRSLKMKEIIMWDYSFAIPSLMILGLLMSNYFLLKRLPLRVNRFFVGLLIIEAIVISSDIISGWACDEYRDLPRTVVILTIMVFFIFFAIRGHAFFAFTCSFFGTRS